MATIKDVAEKAGVSIATVSRIMNNRGPIGEKTRKKVIRAMELLEYQPNEMARALQRSRSSIIGLVVPSIAYAFFSALVDAIEDACHEQGFKLMVCKSGSSEEREREMVQMLRANKVAGVILSSRLGDPSVYTEFSIPIVSVDREIEGISSITSDNFSGGLMAADYLAESGCKNVLLFSAAVPEYMEMHRRLEGFLDGCKRNDMSCHTCLMKGGTEFKQEEVSAEFINAVKRQPGIDGVFITSDIVAANIIGAVDCSDQIIGRSIPIIGYDGSDVSQWMQFSTINQPVREIGECAVDLLVRKIEGKLVQEKSILPVKLVRRDRKIKL